MKQTGEDDLWPRPQFCSIYCPKCGRPAARLVYQTPVARYLHYSRCGDRERDLQAVQLKLIF